LRADDLAQIRNLLLDLVDQTTEVRRELRSEGHERLADRLRDVEDGMMDAVGMLKRAEEDAARDADAADERDRRLSDARRRDDNRYNNRDKNRDDNRDDNRDNDRNSRWDDDRDDDWVDDRDDDWDDDWDDRRWHRRWWRGHDFDPQTMIGIHVGEFGYGWPYRETGIYRAIPAIRYNRVEGLVLGIRRLPLSWDSYERGRVYGHGGYAFGSDEWQYEIGAEARAGGRRFKGPVDFKAGGAYRRTTATQDIWKTSWVENSLAAFFFNYDFLDYFQVEGWTAYGALRLTPYVQITGGYRQEVYHTLTNDVTWSLFGGRDFRFNPPITEGDMNSVVVVAEGGTVADLDWLPRGAVFRLEAEFGRDFGGDFDFNRYLGDARVYIPFNRSSTLSLRVRGGTSTGELPFQKGYTLGGIGSVRSYPQNVLVGTRMLLGNAEYTFRQDWLWDDLMLSGFVDAGWVNKAESDNFDFDDIYPSAGIGVGLVDRTIRLEVAWPLRDFAGSREPSFWLRINPAF